MTSQSLLCVMISTQESDVLQACLDWVCCCPALRMLELQGLLMAVRVEQLPRCLNLSAPTEAHRHVLPQLLAQLSSPSSMTLSAELPPHVHLRQQFGASAALSPDCFPSVEEPGSLMGVPSSSPRLPSASLAPIGCGGRGARRHKASHLLAVGEPSEFFGHCSHSSGFQILLSPRLRLPMITHGQNVHCSSLSGGHDGSWRSLRSCERCDLIRLMTPI